MLKRSHDIDKPRISRRSPTDGVAEGNVVRPGDVRHRQHRSDPLESIGVELFGRRLDFLLIEVAYEDLTNFVCEYVWILGLEP